jgi:hypothetical protein
MATRLFYKCLLVTLLQKYDVAIVLKNQHYGHICFRALLVVLLCVFTLDNSWAAHTVNIGIAALIRGL